MKSYKEFINEAVYKGNMGFMETIQFYEMASEQEIKQLEKLLKEDKIKEAWQLIQTFLKIKLHGEEFGN